MQELPFIEDHMCTQQQIHQKRDALLVITFLSVQPLQRQALQRIQQHSPRAHCEMHS